MIFATAASPANAGKKGGPKLPGGTAESCNHAFAARTGVENNEERARHS
jgi:hypothetical protein